MKKYPNIKKMHFFKNVHVQKIQKCHFSEKKPPEAQRGTEPAAFKNTGVYLYLHLPKKISPYIYTHIYIYTHLQKKQHLPLMDLPLFTEISKIHFPQIRFFGNVFPYPGDFLLKTKMVRTVHRNILYRMDLKICDSKRGFGTKSRDRFFQKWGLKK